MTNSKGARGLRVVEYAIADLSHDPANARTHSDRNIEAVVASLRRFGQQKPIVVDSSGVVRAGNGTLEAARRLGWETIAAVETDLKGSEATAYAIADNRTAELASWDDDVLAAQISGLVQDDQELAFAAGFDETELDELLADLEFDGDGTTGEVVEDEVPEPPADPITKPGDLWILGEHRLLCGDSTNAEDVARLMDGAKADLLLTDPPYGINASNMTMGSGQSAKPKDQRLSSVTAWDQSRPDIKPFLVLAKWWCVWGGNYFANDIPITNRWLCWWKKTTTFLLVSLNWR